MIQQNTFPMVFVEASVAGVVSEDVLHPGLLQSYWEYENSYSHYKQKTKPAPPFPHTPALN